MGECYFLFFHKFDKKNKVEAFAVKTCSPPPGLEPGSSDCRADALPTKLQSETSFHRLCCAFIVSVSLHSPPDEPHVSITCCEEPRTTHTQSTQWVGRDDHSKLLVCG